MSQANAKFSIFVACMSIGLFGRTGWLHAAAYRTNATCSPTQDWSWMNNQNGSSPCLTAAAISQPCFTNDFQVVSLGPNDKYSEAGQSYANKCYCSWAVYNLLEACTACQGLNHSIVTWTQWSQSCGNSLTPGRAYPPEFSIPDSYTFPNWAATDRKSSNQWNEFRFNAMQAQQIRYSNPGDFQVSSLPKTSNNIGAITGGVVGGVLVLVIGIVAAIFLRCYYLKKPRQTSQMSQVLIDDHIHNPSSDNYGRSLGYNRLLLSSSPSNDFDSRVVSSPKRLRTHNPSRSSLLTQESSMSSLSYPGNSSPQPGNSSPSNIHITSHGTVVPFTWDRPLSQDVSNRHGRKMSEVSTTSGSTVPTMPQGPTNPPAYSEAPHGHGHGDFASMAPDGSSICGSTSIITTFPGNFPVPVHERGSMDSNLSTTSAGLWAHTGIEGLYGASNANVPRDQRRISRGL